MWNDEVCDERAHFVCGYCADAPQPPPPPAPPPATSEPREVLVPRCARQVNRSLAGWRRVSAGVDRLTYNGRRGPAPHERESSGLAQKLGQLWAAHRDLQSKSWANLKSLGRPVTFSLRQRTRASRSSGASSTALLALDVEVVLTPPFISH